MLSINSQSKQLINQAYLWIEVLKYNDRGLIPAIIQDASDRKVLGLSWIDKEKLRQIFSSGLMSELEISYKIEAIFYDCDRDALLFQIEQLHKITEAI